MQSCILGVDIGTTAVKTVLFSSGGACVAQAQRMCPQRHPAPGRAEQDPAELADATLAAIRDVMEQAQDTARIEGASFSSVMHGIFLVDGTGRPLTPMLTWADTRAAKEADELRAVFGAALYRRTGVPPHAMLPSAKIRWLLREHPEAARGATRFVSIKEWLIWKLSGHWVTDVATAGATGLFSLATHGWEIDCLKWLGIGPDRLGELVPCRHVLHVQDGEAARAAGLPSGTPVVVGATDGLLANIGAGALTPDTLVVTAGTSGAVRLTFPAPHLDPGARTFCYMLDEERFVAGGASSNTGLAVQWLAQNLGLSTESGGRSAVETLFDMAAGIQAGADGLLFLPYLAGERAPIWDEGARGAFLGLTVRHDRRHLARAGLEGAAFALRDILAALDTSRTRLARASGGLFRSPVWCQIVADMLGLTLEIGGPETTSALGAAIYGWYALGRLETPAWRLQDAQNEQSARVTYRPQVDNGAVYDRLYDAYKDLYAATRQFRSP